MTGSPVALLAVSPPDGVERRPLYEPTANGHERRIRERLEYWEGLRARKR